MSRLRIELLGDLRATRGARVVSHWRTQKTALLLAWLALFKDRAHPREALVELLWPGCEPEAGRSSLSRELSWIRNQLERSNEPKVVVASRATVQLDAETATDVAELRHALAAAERARGGARLEALAMAVELYRGELLPGIYDDAIAAERARSKAAFVGAARSLALEHGRSGKRDLARDLLLRAIGEDPLSEDARRDLMALHAASGEPGLALRVYEDLVERLREDMGAAPSPATEKLAREIERTVRPARAERPLERPSERARAQALTAFGTVTFLAGAPPVEAWTPLVVRHRGRVVPGLGEIVGAAFARPSDALAGALAARRAIGPGARVALDTVEVEGEPGARELERATRLLAAARPGQVLASEETAVLLRRDPDAGVRLEDLGVYRLEGGAAPARVFQPLASDARGPDLPIGAERVFRGRLPLDLSRFFGRKEEAARLREALAPSKKHRLVTLTGPGGIGKTRLALEVVPGLAEEFRGRVHFVPLADVPSAALLASAIAQALELKKSGGDPVEAIAAHVEGRPALLVLDNFEHLGGDGARVVESLLERAPGLACLVTSRHRLGLAGEREHALSPLPTPRGGESQRGLLELSSVQLFLDRARAVRPEIELDARSAPLVAELVRKLEGVPLALALAAGRTQVLALEDILARFSERLDLLASRELTTPERHRTLRAAIEGSVRLLGPEHRRLFARLAVFRGSFDLAAAEAVSEDRSALDGLAELCECSLLVPEGGRFRMLEMLREHGLGLLSKAELERARRLHAEHFLRVVERESPRLDTDPGALDRLAAEQGNVRAALEWTFESPEGAAIGLAIAGALGRFWRIRGPFAEGRASLARALERSTGPSPERARALLAAGGLAVEQGDFAAARAPLEEALEASRASGDAASVVAALNDLGHLAHLSGDLEGASRLFSEAAGIARGLDARLAAGCVTNLATIALNSGDPAGARGPLLEAIALYKKAGDNRGASYSLIRLSAGLVDLGDPAAARSATLEALELARAVGAELDIASALLGLGWLELMYDFSAESAASRFEEALALFKKLEAKRGVYHVVMNLARAAIVIGDLERARALADEGVALTRAGMDKLSTAIALRFAGDAWQAADASRAREAYTESLELLERKNDPSHLAGCVEGLAALALGANDARRAAVLLGAAEALRESRHAPRTPAEDRLLAPLSRSVERALGAGVKGAIEEGRALGPLAAIELAVSLPTSPKKDS